VLVFQAFWSRTLLAYWIVLAAGTSAVWQRDKQDTHLDGEVSPGADTYCSFLPSIVSVDKSQCVL
jgi:hypothetical protein